MAMVPIEKPVRVQVDPWQRALQDSDYARRPPTAAPPTHSATFLEV